jgi:hypothetical protein
MQIALPVLELQYVDASGTKGAVTVKFPLGTTVAVIDAQASVLASLIAPITGCVLIRQRIIYKTVEVPRADADTGSSIYRAGVFFFDCGDDNPLELLSIPGILDETLVTDGPTAGYAIDLSNSDVDAFVTIVTDGIYINQFGDDITAVHAAYVQSRTS